MSRPGAWLKSSESDPKTEAVEAPVAGDRDGTLSCSCPAQKSKNFVSRERNTPLRSVFLSAWECSARQRQSSRRSWSTPELPCGTQPPQRRQPRLFFAELGRRARPAGLSIAGYLFLVAMLISVALAARRIVSCGVPAQWNAPQRSLLFHENKSRSELLAFAIRSFGAHGHRFTIVRDHDATRGMIRPTCLLACVG